MTDQSGGAAYQHPPAQSASASEAAPAAPRASAPQHHLDQPTTEAVLRRAFELAHVEPARDLVFSRSTLEEIAIEVDLPAQAVAAALAEQLADGTDDASLLDRIVGSDRVSVHRLSTASEDEMRSRAVELLEAGHGMRPRVQVDGVVVASKRKDVVGKLARTVRDAQGLGQLGKLRRVEIAAVDVGDEPGALVLSADIGDRRNTAIAGGAAVGAVGGVVVAGAAVVLSPFIAAAAPVVIGAGVVTSRLMHGAALRETEEHLEEAADALTSGEKPEGLISRGAKRALSSLGRRRRR